ncbi:MAG TPA: TIGR02444 family protein [Stellaceae bacterium]|nr:TIGR02444 family protein [Stellaceae bacterium]
MPEPAAASGERFWAYSLAVYGREGVAAACIALQDRHGLDVNFLLLGLFAGEHGCALGAEALARLDSLSAPWRENVTAKLRAVRRWLKAQGVFPAEAAAPLRQAVLAQEIEAERHQHRLMEQHLALAEAPADPAIAAGNLARYVIHAGVAPDAADLADLATLIVQAFPRVAAEDAKAMLGRHLPASAPAAPPLTPH